MVYDQNMLDTLTLVSFMISVANYKENLTQSDKDDLMRKLDQQTRDILVKIEESLNRQNEMLRKILNKLEE